MPVSEPARRALRVPLLAGPVAGRAGGIPWLRVDGCGRGLRVAALAISRGAGTVTWGLRLRIPGLTLAIARRALRVAALAIPRRGLLIPRLLIAWRSLPVSGLRWTTVRLLLLLWRRYDEPCRALARVSKERLPGIVPAGERRRRA